MDLLKKTGWLLALVLLITGLVACEEETEEEYSADTMTGTVVCDVPYFVMKGETVTLTASGIEYPTDVTYRWHIGGVYVDTLAANTVTVRFPDSLGLFTVSATAYSPGFYVSTNSRQVTTIDTAWNTSLQGLSRGTGYITDERDGRSYGYVTLGGLDWFNQNLAWHGAGVPYKASVAAAPLFGSLYTWEEAMSTDVCPEGWRVPDNADWESLAAALGGRELPFVDSWAGLGEKASADAYMNDERMWPYCPDNAHTNVGGWNALPLGYSFRAEKAAVVSGLNEYGCWWSATPKDAGTAFYRYIWYDRADFPMNYTGKNDLRIHVRCVRTHPQSS